MKRTALVLLFGWLMGAVAGIYVWGTTGDSNLAKASFAIVWILSFWLKQ